MTLKVRSNTREISRRQRRRRGPEKSASDMLRGVGGMAGSMSPIQGGFAVLGFMQVYINAS